MEMATGSDKQAERITRDIEIEEAGDTVQMYTGCKRDKQSHVIHIKGSIKSKREKRKVKVEILTTHFLFISFILFTKASKE